METPTHIQVTITLERVENIDFFIYSTLGFVEKKRKLGANYFVFEPKSDKNPEPKVHSERTHETTNLYELKAAIAKGIVYAPVITCLTRKQLNPKLIETNP